MDHTRENLLRLMIAKDLSVCRLAERSGLDERTIRGILNGGNKPHVQTLHRLADGLDVKVEEFFVDPTRLLYRRFDRQTNPVVADILDTNAVLFDGWTEADFDALHNHVGADRTRTTESVLQVVCQMNHQRKLHRILDQLLESSQAEVAAGILDVLYTKIVAGKG